MPSRAVRGLTLLEVVVATAILAIVVAIAFQVLFSAQTAYNEAALAQNLEQRGRAFVDRYKKELMFCRVTSVGLDGSSIRYQVPLSSTASGQLVFGAVHNGDRTGWETELAFIPERIFLEEVSVPVAIGVPVEILDDMDVNRDGDLLDAFVIGRIEQRIYDSLGLLVDRSTAADFVLLAVSGSALLSGDLDADGLADRLFSILDSNGNLVPAALIATAGMRLRVSICHGNFRGLRTAFVLRTYADEFVLRNQQ